MDGLEIKEDLFEPSLVETTNTYVKMHHGAINAYFTVFIIKPASIKGNEHVLQDLFQWPPLRSPRGMKGPYCLPLSDSMTAEWIEAN